MDFDIEQRGRDYWARAGQEREFFLGRSVSYQSRRGLSSAVQGAALVAGDVYRANDFAETLGIWAYVISPTIACEGGRFTSLNSYDRAAFSFGIGQFAAHVPEGDFVCLFRRLLALPEARVYFPELALVNGRVAMNGTRPQLLEEADGTAALMAWLNPDPAAVDARELQVAARLIHWTRSSPMARIAQVQQMADSARAHLLRVARHVPLDRLSATCCVAMNDVLHQGRGGAGIWTKIATALAMADPLDALLAIGAERWASRVATLRHAIAQTPELARAYWDDARRDFVRR